MAAIYYSLISVILIFLYYNLNLWFKYKYKIYSLVIIINNLLGKIDKHIFNLMKNIISLINTE